MGVNVFSRSLVFDENEDGKKCMIVEYKIL